MKINIHAGHNPDGKIACGAAGLIKESTEARLVKDEVIARLRQMGHTVYDCTCDNGTDQADVLQKIVSACNAHTVDLDVSIHFNAGAKDLSGDGRITGTEVLVYRQSGKANSYAKQVCDAIAELGFKNRGVKINAGLYFLRKTKAPAMLIECCFVDDRDDVRLYNAKKMAEAIVYGITGQRALKPDSDAAGAGGMSAPSESDKGASNDSKDQVATNQKASVVYRVQVGAYAVRDNAVAMQKKLKAAGFDAVIVKSA